MHRKPPPTFQCEFCGKVRDRYLCRTKDGRHTSYNMKQKFCSVECGTRGRKWRPINETGHIHSSGYRRLHLRGGGKAYQHRVFMEKTLGRPLRKNENVHHKDGDRLNNAPGNLELWVKMQPPGQRVIDKLAFAAKMVRTYPELAKQIGLTLIESREVVHEPLPP